MEGRFPATDSTMQSPLMYANVIIFLTAMVLGIPGNILSAIVWLRGHVVSKNSSAVYLAAIAIIDLAAQILPLFFSQLSLGGIPEIIFQTAVNLEALLILGFSIERLIAILRPLQVSCILLTLLHVVCTYVCMYFRKFMSRAT